MNTEQGIIGLQSNMAKMAEIGQLAAWPCPVRSVLKRTPVQYFNFFPILYSTTILASHIKKLETYFALFIFLDFRTVCS